MIGFAWLLTPGLKNSWNSSTRVKEFWEFKDLKELEKDRENIRYTLNDDEISQFLAKKEKEEEAEQQRLHRIRERDELVKESYQNIHNLLGL